MQKTRRWLFIVVLGAFLVSAAGVSAGYRDRVEKSFAVRPGGTLEVRTDLGAIEVRTHKAHRVEILLERKVIGESGRRARALLEKLEMDFQRRGNDVLVSLRLPHSPVFGWPGRKYIRLRFRITVPEEYNVDLQTSGGSISVDDLRGEVRCKTSGGSLHFGRIDGPIWARTSGGSVELKGCREKVDVKTSGGSIYIGEVEGSVQAFTSGGSIRIVRADGEVVAHTSGGSIRIEDAAGAVDASTSGGSITAAISRQPQRDSFFHTSGGNITVYFAKGIRAEIDAKTSGGHVETDIPVTFQGKLSKTHIRAKINGGGPLVKLRTSGGSIYLRAL